MHQANWGVLLALTPTVMSNKKGTVHAPMANWALAVADQ